MPEIRFRGIPPAPVEVLTPADPQFKRLLPPLAIVEPIPPYSLIVINASLQPLTIISLRWEMNDHDGRPIANSRTLQTRLALGEYALMTQWQHEIYESQREIIVAIDLMFGPDKSKTIEKFDTRLEAERQVVQALLDAPVGSIRETLQRDFPEPELPNHLLQDKSWFARHLLLQLDYEGEARFRETLQRRLPPR